MVYVSQFPHFIFALPTAHIFLKIATMGQECANVRFLNLPGLGFPFTQSLHRGITVPIIQIKKLRPKVK